MHAVTYMEEDEGAATFDERFVLLLAVADLEGDPGVQRTPLLVVFM